MVSAATDGSATERSFPDEVYMGDCSRGCMREATVRLHKEWVVCSLHYLEHLASERSNEASMTVALIGPFRAGAEFHGCDNLVRQLDRIVEEATKEQEEVAEELAAFRRVEEESLPNEQFRTEIGERERKYRERLAAAWPTEFARVLWELSGREAEDVDQLAAQLARLVGREEDAPLEARLRSWSSQPLDPELLADLDEALDLKTAQSNELALAYAYEARR